MQIELLNEQGRSSATVDAPDAVFARDYNENLVHQIVVAYQANARQGTRAQKDRQQVKHSTRKPFKQKGTGNARAGMTSSPLWRGGGRIFPNSPEEAKKSTKRCTALVCLSSCRNWCAMAVWQWLIPCKWTAPKPKSWQHASRL